MRPANREGSIPRTAELTAVCCLMYYLNVYMIAEE